MDASPLNPADAQEMLIRAIRHQQAGQLTEAEVLVGRLLSFYPHHPDVLHLSGVISHQKGDSALASALIRQAIAIHPQNLEYRANLCYALIALEQFDEAAQLSHEMLLQKSDDADAMLRLGFCLLRLGRGADAVPILTNATRVRPSYCEAWNFLGVSLAAIGQTQEAITAYHQALKLNPALHEAHHNLGLCLYRTGVNQQAAAEFKEALRLKPNYASAHASLGLLRQDLGSSDDAMESFQAALRADPTFTDAEHHLASALGQRGDIEKAIELFESILKRHPANVNLHSNLLFAMNYDPRCDARKIFSELRRWNDRHAAPSRSLIRRHENDPAPDRRLRIGYVSGDFRNHVAGWNFLPLLREHSHEEFEIFCYSNVSTPDAFTERCREKCDTWRNIRGLDDDQASQQIREDKIDILVDLSLHSSDHRLLVFARKPAPVQVSYLAYCSSTGLDTIDYRLSDPHLDPIEIDLSIYSEQTIRLPKTYWCYEPGGPVPEVTGLPVASFGRITFGSMNNFAKVSAPALALWADILVRVPASRILIHCTPGSHRNRALDIFTRAGVSADRIEFIPKQLWPSYVQSLSRIDISLDSFPHGGGITTCDSLFMGIPVVTLSGSTAVGRGGRSILNNIGRPELIANSTQEYADLAVNLANNLPRLIQLRQTLRAEMRSSPLMDAKSFAQDIETVYRRIWHRWCESHAKSS